MTRRTLRGRGRAVALIATVAIGSGSCIPAEPTEDPSASPTTLDPARAIAPPDVRREALVTVVATLAASVEAARAELETVQTSEDAEVAARAADRAVAQLTASEDLAGSYDDLAAAPLLPGPATSRQETIDYGDSFTETLTVARNIGEDGSAVLGLLRDAVAGDLGIWQRDAEGMLDQIDQVSRTRGDVAAVEAAVIELAGEGSRALAYALRASRSDGDERRTYADRALAHLGIISSSIDELADDISIEEPTDG